MTTTLEQLRKAAAKKLDTPKARKPGASAAVAALPNAPGGVERVTLSLHSADTDRLSELEDYLRSLGHRESNRSLLVKVALRGVEFTPALVDHLRAAQAADGRRSKVTK